MQRLLLGLFLIMVGHSLEATAGAAQQDETIFLEAFRIIRSQYVEEIDSKELIQGAIQGMLRKIDPGSQFVPPSAPEVTREGVEIRSIQSFDLGDGIAYIRLFSFYKGSAKDVQSALEKLSSQQGVIKGLVLDLRNNPGGLVTEAAWIADVFLDSGLIVQTDGRMQNQKQKYFARKEGSWLSFPMAVLVNESSAAGSELVAAALQDLGRALVVGTLTAGKGSIQSLISLSDGSALRLTTARLFRPKGQPIEARGIFPDVVVELPRSEWKKSSEAGEESLGNIESDAQLQKAIEILKGKRK